MPNTTLPSTCPACNGTGYESLDVLCKTCFGGGSLPVTGVDRWAMKTAYEASITLSDMVDKINDITDRCNDIMDKCNDIFEKVNV
uniref:Uncharacterized protein n=1 Tax=viral metagenome TaxID=1070528 RepID=A0A6M3JUQ3_9ZZZZ